VPGFYLKCLAFISLSLLLSLRHADALRRASVTVRWTDVTVRHKGYTDPALQERTLQRDCLRRN